MSEKGRDLPLGSRSLGSRATSPVPASRENVVTMSDIGLSFFAALRSSSSIAPHPRVNTCIDRRLSRRLAEGWDIRCWRPREHWLLQKVRPAAHRVEPGARPRVRIPLSPPVQALTCSGHEPPNPSCKNHLKNAVWTRVDGLSRNVCIGGARWWEPGPIGQAKECGGPPRRGPPRKVERT
jgi:hypothetical protein